MQILFCIHVYMKLREASQEFYDFHVLWYIYRCIFNNFIIVIIVINGVSCRKILFLEVSFLGKVCIFLQLLFYILFLENKLFKNLLIAHPLIHRITMKCCNKGVSCRKNLTARQENQSRASPSHWPSDILFGQK